MGEWFKWATAVFAGSLAETGLMFAVIALRGRRAAKAAEAKVEEFQAGMKDWIEEYGPDLSNTAGVLYDEAIASVALDGETQTISEEVTDNNA